jgi:hypothetical protein
MVWDESIASLSRKYNISTNDLRRVCTSMNIPLPDMGYWSKKQFGKETPMKPLHKNHTGQLEISLSPRVEGDSNQELSLSPLIILRREIESDSGIDLQVKTNLVSPDMLIRNAEVALIKQAKTAKDGELIYAGSDNLNINVTRSLINRTLCLMDCFVKAMRHRGHDFKIDNQHSYVILDEIEVEMTIRETRTKIVSNDKWALTQYEPTRRLSIQFGKLFETVSCTDGKVLIEEQLSKVIAKLELLKERIKVREEESRRWRLAYEEKRLIEMEAENRKKMETGLLIQMLEDSNLWKQAHLLREYIDYIETKAMKEGNLEGEIVEWIDWARKKADWLDPLTESYDELLKQVEPRSFLVTKTSPETINYNYTLRQEKKSWPQFPWYAKNRN